ncbi:MAG TPA: hypothetical protein VN673_03375 [Clostridia bacterium]|nr:hypothetical protein [Clostridia bacterium]
MESSLTGELLRLNPDGTRDVTFTPLLQQYDGQARIWQVLIQPDGRILVAGDFDVVNGTLARSFARLNANGTLDASFDSRGGISVPYGGNAYVNALVLQPDGKLLVGGNFQEINDTGFSLLARLNPDGSVDTSFQTGWLTESEYSIYEVRSLAWQPDGKVLVGGHVAVDRTPQPALLRLNADGSLDSSFHLCPMTAAAEVADANVITCQADGKILLGGAFDSFDGQPQPNLVRLLPDGNLDPSFQVRWDNTASDIAPWEIGQVSALALQPDNKVLVGGWFSSIERQPRWGIARVVLLPPEPGTPGDRRMPAVAASDNLYLIAWADQRNAQTNDWDIYAARVTADGRLLDPGGIAVCALPYLQQFPRVASDGHDFLVVWDDARALAAGGPAGVTNYDVYGARITADGRLLEPNGIPICQTVGSQSKPSVAWNGANYLVVWADTRSSSNTQPALDIYGARVSSAGTVLDPAGLPICTAPNQQSWPEVTAWNGDFFAAWTDLGQVPNGIYGTRVTSAGGVVHPGGFPLASQAASFTPGLAANPTGYLMLWPNNPFSGRIGCDVRALRIDPSGENVLANLGVLRQTTNFLTAADVAASSNECLAVWMDDRAGPGVVKVWGARIGPSGVVASNGLEIATMAAPRFWNAPAVASLQGDYLVAWVGPQAGDPSLTDIFATRVSHDGLVRDREGIPISSPEVSPQLEITVPPFSQTRFTGQSASFAVELGGSPPFTYQWCFNASPIAGAAGSTLALTSLQTSNAGLYSVVVANASGAVTSTPALLTVLPVPGGPGSLDVTFDPTAGGQLIGPAQIQGLVKSLASQPDGKLLLGGSFVGVNGRARNNIARLQRDGRLDESFSPGFGTDGFVDDIAVQSDGRILIVGAFACVNGAPRQGLARLHPDGSLDASFHPSIGGYPPTCLALQSDGKILIGGGFTNVCGLPRRALARLNPDGTLDAGFDAAPVITARGPGISALALQADGKLLIAGQFAAAYDRPLARLNPDGSLDSSFLVPQIRESSTVGWVFSLALEQSGRILIGGRFLSVNGTDHEGLARLNADGSLDSTFLAGPLADNKDVSKVVVQPDGKVLIGGSFLGVNGSVRHGLARLLPNGAVDLSFDPSHAVYDNTAPWVNDLLLDAADRLVVAAGLSGQWNRSPHPLCRLSPNGALDGGFALPVILQAGSVARIAVQPDGKLLVLPFLEGTSINGLPCGPLARLLSDGTRDPSFTSPIVGGSATCVLVQPDGKILLGGVSFLLADKTRLLGLIRLNPDGSLDPSFQTESGDYAGRVYSLTLQPDGRILVNGTFDAIRGAGHSFVVRLTANGSLDSSFQLDPQLNPNVGEFDPPINCVAVQPDGKLLIGGWFDDMVPRLVRLNPNGSLDRDLLIPSQNGGVEQIIVQPDGKLLLAGRFRFFGQSQWECVVRIQADGTLDTVFPSPFNWVNSLALQPDGKVLATVVGEPVSLLRYNADGTVDSTFAPDIKHGFGDPTLMSVVLQPDGQVLVVGSFSSVSGIPCHGLARLNNDLVVPRSFVTRQLPGQRGSPGSTVRLLAQPPGTIAVYALQDQPPAAWLVTNISHGGVFDALTGKVKFGPFFDSDARTLGYDILPPPGFVGVGLFAGVASADGASSLIVGDDRMVITSLHPADYSPAEWVMRMDEVTAYAAVWRTGGVWMLPPNPIPVDYVTRAASLWRRGETYVLDCSAGVPPLCWVGLQPLPKLQAMVLDEKVSALRHLPRGYLAGETFEVTIEVSALSTTLAYAVEESFPAGWQIQNISHGGAIDPLHGQIKWGPFCDSTPRTLRYQMVPPAAATGPISFAGSASFDGAATPLGGPAFIGSASRLTWTPQPEKGRWVLQLNGDRNARYLVETSTNLVQWTPLTMVTNSLGQVEIPAPVPSQSPQQQYYRAKLLSSL